MGGKKPRDGSTTRWKKGRRMFSNKMNFWGQFKKARINRTEGGARV